MGDIVPFPKKDVDTEEVELLSCSHCETPSFYIHTDGTVECDNCNHVIGTVYELLDYLNNLQDTKK